MFQCAFTVSDNKEVSGQAEAKKIENRAFKKVSSTKFLGPHGLAVSADMGHVGTITPSQRPTLEGHVPSHCPCYHDIVCVVTTLPVLAPIPAANL